MRKLLIGTILLLFVNILTAQNCTVNADIDQVVCANNSSVTLTGSINGLPVLPKTSLWSQVGGPSATITSPSSLVTTVSGLIGGNTYTFRFSSNCTDGSLVYDEMQVVVNKITIANAGPDFAPICPNASALDRTLAGNALGTGETGKWTIISGSGLAITTPNSLLPKGIFTLNTTAGNTVLRWTITNASTGCTSYDEVTIPTIGGTATVSAGLDRTLTACYTPPIATATLAGSLAGNGTGGQQGTWTVVSGPNVPGITSPNVNNSGLTNLIQGVYIFRWTVVGPCYSGSDDVQITVPAGIGAATAVASTNVRISGSPAMPFCDGRDNVVLESTVAPKVFETCLWTRTAGPNTAVIGSPNSPTTTVTNLDGSSNYTFSYQITNPLTGCTSIARTVTISYGSPPSLSITTPKPLFSACGATTASIAFTQSGTGTAQYSIISGPTTTSFPTIPSVWANAGSSPLNLNGLDQGGTYLVRLRKSSGAGSTCSTVYDEITVYMSKAPSLATAGSNSFLSCSTYTGALNGNIPAAGTGTGVWSQVSGPNTATFADKFNPKTGISGLTNGNYVFRWLISNGDFCSSNQADVSLGVASTAPTTANAGANRTVCYNSPLTLDGNATILNETGTWTVSPSSGIVFSNINNKNAIVNGMSISTVYTFTWKITNGCGSSQADVVITANATLGPIASLAGPDQCLTSGTTTATLAGNNPSPGTGEWTKIEGGSATITSPTQNNSGITGLTDGIYKFEWAITRNSCTVTRDTVVITISKTTTTAAAGLDQVICGTSTTLAGNPASTGLTSGVGTWTLVSGSGGVAFADVNNPTSGVSGLSAGTYILRWTITNGTCSSNFDEVKLSVSIPPATALAGLDKDLCGVSTVTMTANTPGVGEGTGYWSIISGPNTPTITSINSGTTGITGLTTGSYIFRWTIQNGPYCTPSTDEVIVTVVPTAAAGVDQSFCGSASSANLFGNPSTTGVWSQVGVTPNVATFTVTTPSTATVSGLIEGIYTFRYTISTPGCNSSDDMTVTISNPTVANAGADKDLCGATGWTMTANTALVGAGTWTRVSGPNTPTLSSMTNPSATVTGAVAGTYMYDWTITQGGCLSVDRVIIKISNIDATANAGGDQTNVCGTIAYLAATAPTNGVGGWSQISGPNSAVFSSSILNNANVSGLIPGTYVFRWTITSGICTAVFDEVSITVFPNPTTPTAGLDQNLCGATSTTLAGNIITPGGGKWTKVSGPACNIVADTNPTTTINSMSAGTYIFRWTATLGTCSLFDEVTVLISETPSTAQAGGDFSRCLYSPLNLAATTPVVGTGVWTQVSGAAVNIVTPGSPTTSILGAVVGSYEFKWTVSNGVCPSNSDNVIVTIDNNVTQPNAGPDQRLLNISQFTMAGNVITVGSKVWTLISGPNIPTITNINLNTTTVTGAISGVYIFRWTATNGQCSEYDEVTIFNNIAIADNDINQTPINTSVSGQLITNDIGITKINSAQIGVTNIPINTSTVVSGIDDLGNPVPNAGSITIQTDGTYIFVPSTDFTGTINPITYVGGGVGSDTDTANLTIEVIPKTTPFNDRPIAQNDVATTKINVTITGSTVLINDRDPDGNTLTITSASGLTLGSPTTVSGKDENGVVVPNAGTVNLNATTGAYTYIPAAGFTGTVNDISYTISDSDGGTDDAILSITVLPNNGNTTFANDDANSASRGITMTGNVLTNDFDPEANTQTVSSASALYAGATTTFVIGTAKLIPTVGTFTLNLDGSYNFVPLSTFLGTVPVIYNKCDNGGPQACDNATLYLTSIPTIVIAENDINQTPANTAVSGQLMTNDEGVTTVTAAGFTLGTPKQVSGKDKNGNVFSNAGTLTINSDGTYIFTPATGFVGMVDPVTYTGTGAGGATDNAILSIEVIPAIQPGNNPPTAQNDASTTEKNKTITSNVFPNDSDPDGNTLIITSASGLTLGSGTIVSGKDANGNVIANAGTVNLNATTGEYTFIPTTGFIGTVDDITYTISDGNGGTDTAILSISVIDNLGNNTFANDDANSAPKGTTMTGNVLTNDFDPEANSQTASSASALYNGVTTTFVIGTPKLIPTVGTFTLNLNGSYNFVPLSTFVGTVPIKYNKCDNGSPQACDEATLYLTSLPIVIIAENDINQTPVNTAVSGQLMTNDEGVTTVTAAGFTLGTPKTVSGRDKDNTAVPNAGSLTINGDGTYTFTPVNGFVGTIDPITYTGTGTAGATDNAILSIEVIPAVQPGNNPPTAQNDVNTTEVDITISSTVLSNDSDPDVDALTVTSATGLTLGTATLVAGKDASGAAVTNAGTVKMNTDGTYTYVPTTGFIGTVNDITYTISDGNGGTDKAILSISVIGNYGNNTFANDDANSAPKGTTMTGNVFTNDFDPEANTQTVSSASALYAGATTTFVIGTAKLIPTVGTFTLNIDGSYNFVPLSTFVGTVPIKYNKCDNGTPQACDEATLYLTSLPIVIIAENDINQTPANTAVSGQLMTNDEGVTSVTAAGFTLGTPKTVSGRDKNNTAVPNAGSLTINGDGTYTFTPVTGFVGTIDPITYTGLGVGGATDNAILSIEVIPVVQPGNNPPIAQNDVNTTEVNITINSTVLSNDCDPDKDILTITAATIGGSAFVIGTAKIVSGKDPSGAAVANAGTVKINSVGTYTYIPTTGFVGTVDDITYTISDGKLGTDKAILSISVINNFGNNTFANDDANSAPKGATMTGDVLTNDFDPEANTQTVSSASALYAGATTPFIIGIAKLIPTVGTFTLNLDGSYNFVPLSTFVGTVPIKYNKCDNGTPQACDEATLYLTSLAQIQVWVGNNTEDWNTATNWKSGFVPTSGDDVVFATEANNPTVLLVPNSGPVKRDLVVPTGETKVVGNLTNASDKALVIPAGTAVIVNAEVISFDHPNKLFINADSDPAGGFTENGSFIAPNLANCATTTIMANIQLYAKGDKNHPYNWTDNIVGSPTFGTNFTGKYSWQFFGVPVESIQAESTFYAGFLREYDESINKEGAGIINGSYYFKWTDLKNSSILTSFKGYGVTQDAPTIYTIQGKLMLCSQEITLTRRAAEVIGSTDANIENKRYGLGQNVIGNSFTAAIPIDDIDFDNVKYDNVPVSNASGNFVEKTVYLYNTGSFGEWTNGSSSQDVSTAGTYRAIPQYASMAVYSNIPSMNGFLLRHLKEEPTYVATANEHTGKNITMTLPYKKLVKNDKPQTAPKAQLSYLEMQLKGSTTVDQLWLFSQAGTSSAFDNGWDGRKFFGRQAAYLFALSEAGNMQVNTTDNIIGTRIAFVPDGSENYEMTIRKSNLGEYSSLYLADLHTGIITELKDELTTYSFNSSSKIGKDEQRFRIVASADRSTWTDNVYLNAYSEGKNLYLSNWTNEIGRMSLYDMSGRKLIELEIPALIDRVIPVNLERGAYVIQLRADDQQFSTKCIIR